MLNSISVKENYYDFDYQGGSLKSYKVNEPVLSHQFFAEDHWMFMLNQVSKYRMSKYDLPATDAKVDCSTRFTVFLDIEDVKNYEQLCTLESWSKANLTKCLILETLSKARSKGVISCSALSKGKRYE